MRQILLFTTSLLLTSTVVQAQDSDNFEGDYEPIRASLESWDPVRGAWLADAMPAVVNQEDVPVRTFPENITPMEMMALVPSETRDDIRNVAQNNQNAGTDNTFWTGMNSFVQSASCSEVEATSINRRPRQARSYGDPHLVTYDGERISFQAVGEFVLTRANNNRFEVQTRQKPVQSDFSLNSAVAMNVNGDRVCLYAEDLPDNFRNTPLRVNGQPVEITGGHYFLPNGGIVRRSGQSYIIDWPTGESVNARSGRTSGMNFYNVSVSIVPCGSAALSGVLGNADGNGRNDFDADAWNTPRGIFASNNDNWERERSAFAVRNLADQHRVTQTTTLFDYGMGESTFTFTDRSYPRVIRTIDDLDPVRRQRAQRACNDAGIRGADINGCIYDNAYLNITPCPEPPIREPIVTPETVTPIREPIVNTNPEPPIVPIGDVGPGRTPGGNGNGNGDIKPGNTAPADGIDTPRTPVPREPGGNTPITEETTPVRNVETEEPKKRRRITWGPATSTPTESTPTRTPTRTTPTRSTPTRTTPTRSTPTRTTPTRSTPTRTTPRRSTPTRSTPTRSTPTRTSPSRGGGRGGR
ncbi:MAG: hypothetical protein Crog4KO_15070 [Crocinitomicaceae bacterium]